MPYVFRGPFVTIKSEWKRNAWQKFVRGDSVLNIQTAVLTVADSRDDYFAQRAHFVDEFLKELDWMRDVGGCYWSPVIRRMEQIPEEVRKLTAFGAQSIVLHVPIWADPAFASGIAVQTDLPVVLLGNSHPGTSSVVGLLGAGGALDQINRRHERIIGLEDGGKERLVSFLKAAAAAACLRGKSMVRFGDCSLGIMTANPDAMLWLKDFGVSVRYVDQSEIVKEAEALDTEEVEACRSWLTSALGSITFSGEFTPEIFYRQIRSYLATKKLADQHHAAFVGVKCQPELSNHYTAQCLAHMLLNGPVDETGAKAPLVHACESDANGAITMYLLGLLSGGSASLMDVRKVDTVSGRWILANCGAVPSDHYAAPGECPMKGARMCRHLFGEAGGGACTGTVKSGTVTMARLCLKENRHWMAIVRGCVQEMDAETRALAPAEFPAALIQTAPMEDFLQVYDSNHIHITFGDVSQALVEFCRLKDISYRLW